MMLPSLGSRARKSLLAAAVADSGIAVAGSFGQPMLFGSPRPSDWVWLPLATCEAMARSGGRIGGEQAAAVLREWLGARRFQNAGADAMKPVRDLAAGVPWQRSGVTDGAHMTTLMRIMPLAFVVDPDRDGDRALLDEVVSVTSIDPRCLDDARAVVAAVRSCLTQGTVPSTAILPAASGLHPSVARALHIGSESDLDFEAALRAAGPDAGDGVAAMIGFLLGAADCTIPAYLLEALPEPDTLDDVIEPMAQMLSAI